MENARSSILVVDDDPEILELVGNLLNREGYGVRSACDATSARRMLDSSIDLIVLDLMLPDQDGLSLTRTLRQQGFDTPIIMLTAKGDDFDRVLGLEIGADDYLAKPFHSRELLARIKAVLRRSRGPASREADKDGRFFSFGEWRLDTAKRELISTDDVVVFLSGNEFDLLMAFLTWPQAVLSRDKLIDAVHGRAIVISDRSIDILVSRLRRKLGDNPKQPKIIRTMWGDGYLFTPEVLQ
jgi:two-component system OmpR family response regulator